MPADGSFWFPYNASPVFYRTYPIETLDANIWGLRRLLDFYAEKKIRGFVFFSSSEIYGDPTPENIPTPESYRGNVDCQGPRACYDESKRFGETMCMLFVKHWKINNFIRTDRYKETVYQEEKAILITKENKAYTLGIPNDNQRYTQVRLGKDSIGKDSIGKGRLVDEEEPQPPLIYQQIVDKFNEICISFPKVVKITKSINESIRSCLETYSQEELITVFEKAEQSNFLKGDNNHNWQADFEWLIKDDNIAKALNGKYDNNRQFNQEPTNNQSSNRFNNFNQREYSKEEMDDLEKKLLSR